jgi:hypothetical protein
VSKKLSLSRRALTLLGLGAIIAVLAPVGVVAATNAVKIQDGNGSSKAQVDAGSLRVGDGEGAMTVNGTGNNGNVPVQGNVGVPGGVNVNGGSVGVSGVSGDVSTVAKPTTILAQGDCDSSSVDSYTDSGTIPAGKTVVGMLLSDDNGGSQMNTLIVTAPSSNNGPSTVNHRLFELTDAQNFAGGYAQFGSRADFGPGIKLSEQWSINCTGQPGSSQGNGLWIVWGY